MRVGERHVAGLQAKLTTTSLPSRRVEDVVRLLNSVVTRMRRQTDMLRRVLPASVPSDERVDVALTDVAHRTLFGLDPAINVHAPPPGTDAPETLAETRARGAALIESLRASAAPKDFTQAGARTLDLLLKAGHDVLVTRGYQRTRVDDITDVAEVSHGAFYRYFENKEHIVRLLGLQALEQVSATFDEIPAVAAEPGPASSAALRQWLRRYGAAHATHVAMIRVWLDATADDPKLGAESVATLDWGRRRLVRFLSPRGFGDVECEALLAVGLVDLVGAGGTDRAAVEAGALVIERGLLGFGESAADQAD
jgi:AcrR family transcriptional regulator